MSRPSIDALLCLLGLRQPRTAVTAAEGRLLADLASGRGCVVEVGVYQGVTSSKLAAAIAPGGCLWLVDPFCRDTRPERLLGVSFNERIARRGVRPWAGRVRFVRLPSIAAAAMLAAEHPVELIFIDADHSYRAVRDDFLAWSRLLAADGVLAFHDSRRCPARPELDATTGPVQLVDEMLRGEHGAWSLVAEADSVAAIRRGGAGSADHGTALPPRSSPSQAS
jgi:predicted O-methyltransferase YrrM